MNNFEIIKIFDRMISNTRFLSMEVGVYYINKALSIDKNSH